MFKSYGECWYFSPSRKSTRFVSGHKFRQTCCGLWFEWQVHFQSLCSAIRIFLAWVLLSGQPGIWVVVYHVVQFSKFLVWGLGSDPCWHTSGVSPGAHKLFYGVGFNFSLSMISLVPSLYQKSGNLVSLLSVLTATAVFKIFVYLFHIISSTWESIFLYSVWLTNINFSGLSLNVILS